MPKTIKQFTKLIKEAKNHTRYAFDDDGMIFHRGVWRGETGKNVAFALKMRINLNCLSIKLQR